MNLELFSEDLDYTTSQLIPYLGNKRALVPRLRSLFQVLTDDHDRPLFLDPFAGAGSVSRLARILGMRVKANDWEPYAYAVNRAWLIPRESELACLWPEAGGLGAELSLLNSFHPERRDRHPDPEPASYMALWYAPRDTSTADWRVERLFYTRENAVFLDRVREYIERAYPRERAEADPGSPDTRRRDILLGLLILEAGVHANTSGVFKAFHKGFGGHGLDALPRILGAMELERPVLPEAEPAEVHREDAAAFVRRWSADLVYLDPPYNQHQYGSNYHLLNTLVLWNRDPAPLARGPDGRLISKAGIPRSWTVTRSAYCGRSTARTALAELIDSVDSRALLMSYNSEGLVPPEELYEMLSTRWDVRPEVLDYVRYRGGRQSVSCRVRNQELVYVCRARNGRKCREPDPGLARFKAELRLRRLLTSGFDPRAVAEVFVVLGASEGIKTPLGNLWMWRLNHFLEPVPDFRDASPEDLDRLSERLESCEVTNHARAIEVMVGIARSCMAPSPLDPRLEDRSDALKALAEAVGSLRKLAHPKYVVEYETAEETLIGLARDYPGLAPRLDTDLKALRAQRLKRLADV